MVGYDTNMCVIDKPCGSVQLSTELRGSAEVLLIRDTTRPGGDEYGNPWMTTMMNVNLIEGGAWLPRGEQHIRSLLLGDLLSGFGLEAESKALPALSLPVPQAAHVFPPDRPFPLAVTDLQSNTAIVVVSAADDFDNDGFQARVDENMALHLMPLLDSVRGAGVPIIHIANGRHLSHTPRAREFVINSTAQFAQVVRDFSFTNLLYCGYAANREVMFGVGGMAHFYAYSRYHYSDLFPHVAPIPAVAWIPEATLGLEVASSIEGSWGLKMALTYRHWGGQLSSLSLKKVRVCTATPLPVRNTWYVHGASYREGRGCIDAMYRTDGQRASARRRQRPAVLSPWGTPICLRKRCHRRQRNWNRWRVRWHRDLRFRDHYY
jgi:hypothetical protein